MVCRRQNALKLLPLLLFVVLNVAVLHTVAQVRPYDVPVRSLDLILFHCQPAFSGVVVIAQAGKIKYARAAGMADIEKQKPVTIGGQFGGGSVCKQFTAVLVLQEMEKGRLSLGDTVGRYLPGLAMSWKDSVTVKQLLQHTSGVYAPDAPLAFTPGSSCLYSNYGYQLLGKIVERTSGKSFCEMASALFARCGMTHTVDPALCAGSPDSLVQSYLVQPNGKLQATDSILELLNRIGEASGGIVTTAEDLVRWNECLHGGELLHNDTYRMMWEPSRKIRQHPVFGEVSYGLSFPLQLHGRVHKICHSGLVGGSGFYCINFYYPDTKTSLVVMQHIGNESIPTTELFALQMALADTLEAKMRAAKTTTSLQKQKIHAAPGR